MGRDLFVCILGVITGFMSSAAVADKRPESEDDVRLLAAIGLQ